MVVYWTKCLAFEAGLKQHCTDIIRFSHGASGLEESLPQLVHTRAARRLHDLRENELKTLTKRRINHDDL